MASPRVRRMRKAARAAAKNTVNAPAPAVKKESPKAEPKVVSEKPLKKKSKKVSAKKAD
jgi:hypothetical protein